MEVPVPSVSDDEVELYHDGGSDSRRARDDALYRALVPTLRRRNESPSWDNVLALSHVQRGDVKRRR